MEFYSSFGSRPVRLCEKTRAFAFESLQGKYGRDAMAHPCVVMDSVEGFESLSELERYDAMVDAIATEAPLRICEGERISGAATLGLGIMHRVPATFRGESFASVSHLTVDFESVLTRGVSALQTDAMVALERYRGTEKQAFAQSCVNCLNSFRKWHGRYLAALKDREEYRENYNALLRVPFETPRSFYEAVQSLWFTFAFLRLCGNFPGIGRIDYLLGDYLKQDLENGVLTLSEAREILAHFFIKGCEWVRGEVCGSGDAQHYQNLVLCGVDRGGRQVVNEVTYLVLDILEELPIGDFPTTVRLSRQTEDRLIKRVAEVMRYGGGALAVYNEDLILDALTDYGYPLTEARMFANDGCWEVQIPGKTFFIYRPFDGLQVLLERTLKRYEDCPVYEDFESLYDAFCNDLRGRVDEIVSGLCKYFTEDSSEGFVWKTRPPCTVVSVFEQGCMEKGLSYHEGGPVYNVYSPHFGGFADAVNSLYAFKKMVFDERKISFSDFCGVLRDNWDGNEILRQYARNKYEYYGNDNDEADEIAVRLISDFAQICADLEGRCGYRIPCGISTFGRQLEWSRSRPATPFGAKAGDVLAANSSPTPGTDTKGATAIIRSYCKPDLRKTVTGSALDIRLLPSSVKGEGGLAALEGLLRGFVALGGYFMQIDVADGEILRRAQEHPEEYRTLSVRVSGWNARFITLDRHWQDMVIAQNEKQ
ncbi:MAG: hypothetical protein IJC19_02365 [Clostridia bacterium]|nr:hypothetical protein [Clostridia bacterium]